MMFSRSDADNTSRFFGVPDAVPLSTPNPGTDEQALQLTVVFTTVQGTLAALKEAGNLAHQLGARIRILVPQVVSYALPLDRPAIDPLFKIRKFRTLCAAEQVDTRIEVRLCRDAGECIQHAISPESVVLIGGRRRLLPTRAQRLVNRLRRSGHGVIFVRQT